MAEGHVSALSYLQVAPDTAKPSGYGKYSVFNLGLYSRFFTALNTDSKSHSSGTGIGYSVLDMIDAMKSASGRALPYEFGPRREGDIATCYASVTKAQVELGWVATRTLEDMCRGEMKMLSDL